MQITSTQRKAIDHYYNELESYHTHKVTHETAVRSAFQNLLAAFAQSANWTLIPEQTLAKAKDLTALYAIPSTCLVVTGKPGIPVTISTSRYAKRSMPFIRSPTLFLRIPAGLYSTRTISSF